MLTSLLSLALLDAGGPGLIVIALGFMLAFFIIVIPIIISIIILIVHGIKCRIKRDDNNDADRTSF